MQALNSTKKLCDQHIDCCLGSRDRLQVWKSRDASEFLRPSLIRRMKRCSSLHVTRSNICGALSAKLKRPKTCGGRLKKNQGQTLRNSPRSIVNSKTASTSASQNSRNR